MADEIVTEILEMTVSIERSIFKADGFPKGKLFLSAKAAVARKGTPDQVSADLQKFVRAELDKLQVQETGNGKAKAPEPAQDQGTGGMALLGAGKGAPPGEAPKGGGQPPISEAEAQKGFDALPGGKTEPKAPPAQAPPQSPPPAGAGSPAPKEPPAPLKDRDAACSMTEPQRKKIYALENRKKNGKTVTTQYMNGHNVIRFSNLSQNQASAIIDILNACPDL